MAYLVPYSEVFRGRRFTEPVRMTRREHEARVFIPQIAEQVGIGMDWLWGEGGLLGKLGSVGKDILLDPKKLGAFTKFIKAWKWQGGAFTSGQQQGLAKMGVDPSVLALLLSQYEKDIPEPTFMDKYGGWIIGGGLGLATLVTVGVLLKRR